MKEKLLISFSGGETSGLMTIKILEAFSGEKDIVVVFANTGEENQETLDFVHQCDEAFGFNTIWVEAFVHPGERLGTTHTITSYEAASKNGEPYESHIKKYGIPNMKFPHCTRELKRNPIRSFVKSLGWTGYSTAIGIRTDESRRVSNNADTDKIIYPLLDWFPTDKQDVNEFWSQQSFRLQLKEHEGNCKWCWKKSDSKLLRLFSEKPEIFDFPERMEKSYPRVGAEFKKDIDARDRTFFRGNRSVEMLRKLHLEVGSRIIPINSDENSGCSESCEIYETEQTP